MSGRRSITPASLGYTAGLLMIVGMILLLTKVALMRNFVPPTSIDASGVVVTTGPYSYDNNVLDGIWLASWGLAIALVIISVIWRKMRPMTDA